MFIVFISKELTREIGTTAFDDYRYSLVLLFLFFTNRQHLRRFLYITMVLYEKYLSTQEAYSQVKQNQINR